MQGRRVSAGAIGNVGVCSSDGGSNGQKSPVPSFGLPAISFENTTRSRLSAVQSDLMTEMFQPF